MACNRIRLTIWTPHRKVHLVPHPFLSLRSCPVNLVIVKPRALHQLHLGALGADDVVAVGDEATSDQRGFAARADEAVVMPVPVLERDEASATNTCELIDANRD